MNKTIIIGLGIVLTSLFACETKEKKKTNTIPQVESRDLKGLKIAFYYSDSLKKYFDYFKEEEAIVNKKQADFQKQVERKTMEYQSYIARNNEKLKNGLLSENEQMQIQQRAQQMEAALMQFQEKQGAVLEKETMKKLEVISKKIEVFGKQFCEENKIDILLIHGQGGQINFINPSMDVTKDFTAYLNEHQKELEEDIQK
jgi:Skp family chaperone for outer membrane proteins